MKILIDLSILKNPNCGLGQVALNYGQYFQCDYEPLEGESITLLVPKSYIGKFGDKVKYVEAKKIYRIFPFLIKFTPFDVWHSMHQLSRFFPWGRNNVLTIHDYNFYYEKNGRKVDKYLRKIRRKVALADTVVAISYFTESEVQNFTPTDKTVHVIYNGLERIDLLPDKNPADVKEPFLFTIGEVKRKKNFGVLLDIMKLMPEYQLYIAGNDNSDYAQELKKRIENENINNVHIVGIMTGEEKCWMYRNCTAFVFPSLFEGFGLPVLEAMLFHKPVISSRSTSLAEICLNHATFFPQDFNATGSANAIRKAIEETSGKMLDDAFEYASSFSWKKHMEKYLRIYRHRKEDYEE